MVEEVDRDHGQPLQEIWTLLVRSIAFALSPNACRHTQVDERAARQGERSLDAEPECRIGDAE